MRVAQLGRAFNSLIPRRRVNGDRFDRCLDMRLPRQVYRLLSTVVDNDVLRELAPTPGVT